MLGDTRREGGGEAGSRLLTNLYWLCLRVLRGGDTVDDLIDECSLYLDCTGGHVASSVECVQRALLQCAHIVRSDHSRYCQRISGSGCGNGAAVDARAAQDLEGGHRL